MSCQCAWCGLVMGHKASEYKGISHGICDPCAEELLADLDRVAPSETTTAAEELAVLSECY